MIRTVAAIILAVAALPALAGDIHDHTALLQPYAETSAAPVPLTDVERYSLVPESAQGVEIDPETGFGFSTSALAPSS